MTVLLCPLDWGLGHASRCIPIIRKLLAHSCNVVVGAYGAPLALLKQEFGDNISYISFPGMSVKYSPQRSMALGMALQAPSFFYSIWKENRMLQRIIKETAADVVISDNRYGLWSKKATTVFITHQVFIQPPATMKWVEPFLFFINNFFIKKFEQCWVPDFSGEINLSGILSHKRPLPHLKFIGPITRFHGFEPPADAVSLPLLPHGYSLCILSGPEPQRSILEEELIRQSDESCLPMVFVRGRVIGPTLKSTVNRIMINHAPLKEMHWLISNAAVVVGRPGYTTLMDLSAFGKKALMIPTPGQTEQEYLAHMLEKNQYAHCVAQENINLERDIPIALSLKGIPLLKLDDNLLEDAVSNLLKGFGH